MKPSFSSGPRQAAIQAILTVDAGIHVQDALNRHIQALTSRDRQLSSDLVYGTLRCRIRLQHILGRILPEPGKLPPAMRIALESAVYSILFQDKVPDWASVAETVKIVKQAFGQKLANVANAALRALTRSDDDLKNAAFYANTVPAWESVFYAMPQEIVSLWQIAYGKEIALNLMARSFDRPHTGLRVNLLHPSGPHILEALASLPDAEAVSTNGVAFGAGSLPASVLGNSLDYWKAQGAISFQAAASQLVLDKLGLYDDWIDIPIWDACSGVGGKTLAMLERGLNVGMASDSSWQRITRIPLECSRLNLAPPMLALLDAANPPLREWHGNILADVPCSGLGVLARRPDLKARFKKRQTEKLIHLQREILFALASLLQPGKDICYLTCTLNPAENENQINWLLTACHHLELLVQWQTPHEHPWLEGMYGARIRKTSP